VRQSDHAGAIFNHASRPKQGLLSHTEGAENAEVLFFNHRKHEIPLKSLQVKQHRNSFLNSHRGRRERGAILERTYGMSAEVAGSVGMITTIF